MKKKILLCLTCLVLLFGLTGCSKEIISADDFKTTVEKRGFTVSRSEGNEDDKAKGIQYSSIAVKDDGMTIMFVEFDNEGNAMSLFTSNKEDAESQKSGNYSQNEVNVGNYNTYELTDNSYYKYLSRVGNTLLITVVKKENKETIREIIDELNY